MLFYMFQSYYAPSFGAISNQRHFGDTFDYPHTLQDMKSYGLLLSSLSEFVPVLSVIWFRDLSSLKPRSVRFDW